MWVLPLRQGPDRYPPIIPAAGHLGPDHYTARRALFRMNLGDSGPAAAKDPMPGSAGLFQEVA